jgi:hypothetical protein
MSARPTLSLNDEERDYYARAFMMCDVDQVRPSKTRRLSLCAGHRCHKNVCSRVLSPQQLVPS